MSEEGDEDCTEVKGSDLLARFKSKSSSKKPLTK